jgi:hypothetical protein
MMQCFYNTKIYLEENELGVDLAEGPSAHAPEDDVVVEAESSAAAADLAGAVFPRKDQVAHDEAGLPGGEAGAKLMPADAQV